MTDITLTRATQVLEVLQAGGFILESRRILADGVDRRGICTLFDAQGRRIEAWQAAMWANMKRLRKDFEVQAQGDNMVRWGLRA